MSLSSSLPAQAWQAVPPPGYGGPRIALIHGLLAGEHMQRHLLSYLRAAGQADATLYGNHQRIAVIADALAEASAQGRPLVLAGFSQGGFQIVKVARELQRRGIAVDLAVSVAAGGFGRWYPAQWGFEPRGIPGNVRLWLNYWSEIDVMGCDRPASRNEAIAAEPATRVENLAWPAALAVDHLGTVRCYPEERVHPAVRHDLLARLRQELARLSVPAADARFHPDAGV